MASQVDTHVGEKYKLFLYLHVLLLHTAEYMLPEIKIPHQSCCGMDIHKQPVNNKQTSLLNIYPMLLIRRAPSNRQISLYSAGLQVSAIIWIKGLYFLC